MRTEDTGSLVVYSGRSESLVGPIIQQFREATGIDIQVKYGNTSEMAATLQEEGRRSLADVFWHRTPARWALCLRCSNRCRPTSPSR